ncbi:MAG: phosphomannomutase/phosphoglucomutase [Planctomycetota bacterium]|jgi:phosphomannomutase
METIDRVFKAYDVRGIYGDEIDEDFAWKIGHACGQFLRSLLSGYERGQAAMNRLVVGRDMRPHSEPLTKAMIEGITSSGTECVDIGMVDTPMVYFAINHLGACGGIQVTASHNPIEYNGFKISGVKARPIGVNTGLKEIQHIVSTLRRMPVGASLAPVHTMDLWEEYRKHVWRFLRVPRRLKVVVDASNGMGGVMIPKVFQHDSANVEIALLNSKLGKFVHPPDPLVDANLKMTQTSVRRRKADFGICMDGDADRCMFVDETGAIVRCDLMTALFARHFLKEEPGSTIMYDLRSSRVVPEEVRDAGGVARRERVGHAFMKKAMADAHGLFGGELSGHFYFRDNFNTDSGAIAFATALTVISSQDKPLSELVAPFKRYSHSGEMNFEVKDKEAKMDEVAEKFADAEVDRLDGVTCQYEDWWCNVRPSNTEPLLRLTLEARDKKMMNKKLNEVKSILGEPVAH